MPAAYTTIADARLNQPTQGQRFSWANAAGVQFYSGADCRFYFDNILVENLAAIGFQQAQNVRPLYGYHSYNFDALQYGTKLIQGYLQFHFTESGYLPTILATIEAQRRGRLKDVSFTSAPQSSAVNPNSTPDVMPGATLEDVLARIGSQDNTAVDPTIIRDVMSQLNLNKFPKSQDALITDPTQAYGSSTHNERAAASVWGKLQVNGLFPPKPLHNDFSYNPRNTTLRDRGFDITVVYGDGSIEDVQQWDAAGHATGPGTPTFSGTFRKLYEVHLIAGPNTQFSTEGQPIDELFTFISKDIG